MKREDWATLTVSAIIIAGLVLNFGLRLVEAVTTTTTITGWNVPNGTTFGNGFGGLIFPFIGLALFVMFPMVLGRRGDFIVTMALLGMTAGSLFGLLTPVGGGNGTVPFGMLVVSGTMFAVWMWQGGRG